MGNFWGTLVDKPSPRTTKPSTLGTVKNNSNDDELSDSNISTNRFSAIGNLDGMILPTPNFRIFCFSELKTATRNFSPDSVLGEDGFGTVFKGWLDEKTYSPSKVGNGMEMTIKRKNPESWQGSQEWLSEVDILGRLSHPNLIKLLGCCREDEEVLIVYEFMQQGSLASHLFQTRSAVEPLSWSICLKIAIGAAQGLAFLHTLEKKVIHRDIKASSILLDGNYNAKISSFGLAAYMPSDFDTHLPMPVVGTYGYAAPEYIATGDLNVKSDVYGFGVVLLEMLTGLRTQDRNRPSGQQNLVDWVKPSLSNPRKLQKIMDARLEGQYVTRQVWEAANLTLNCLAPNPKCRPSMKEVVETLQRLEAEGVQNHHPKHHTHRHKHLQAVGV